ncbi:hypothetical protein DSL72_000512 [Monilinia vaccinii-corymbosi]|uniref:HIG1 domain-containing protein n=1 Tax=Monilinia vaccinii-corymbosi TaxID=61207 RepID=A0A8A3NZJ0_9HELO|nr:hypothetical protein DSL72_000512 [Monilinia vaccinii-corymbosi]
MSNNTPLPSSFDGDTDFYEENPWRKIARRMKEEPLIPLGCLLTTLALIGATRSMRAGDHNRTQRMFRARIYAQGFTVLAMVAGSMYWESDRKKRKEFEGLLADQKAKEKKEAWVRELEARDEEEKEIQRARDQRRRRAEERQVAPVAVTDAANAAVEEGDKAQNGIMDQVKGVFWGKK